MSYPIHTYDSDDSLREAAAGLYQEAIDSTREPAGYEITASDHKTAAILRKTIYALSKNTRARIRGIPLKGIWQVELSNGSIIRVVNSRSN